MINNATVTPMGAVKDVSIEEWDLSYRVNLQGPVVLARTFCRECLRGTTASSSVSLPWACRRLSYTSILEKR